MCAWNTRRPNSDCEVFFRMLFEIKFVCAAKIYSRYVCVDCAVLSVCIHERNEVKKQSFIIVRAKLCGCERERQCIFITFSSLNRGPRLFGQQTPWQAHDSCSAISSMEMILIFLVGVFYCFCELWWSIYPFHTHVARKSIDLLEFYCGWPNFDDKYKKRNEWKKIVNTK